MNNKIKTNKKIMLFYYKNKISKYIISKFMILNNLIQNFDLVINNRSIIKIFDVI